MSTETTQRTSFAKSARTSFPARCAKSRTTQRSGRSRNGTTTDSWVTRWCVNLAVRRDTMHRTFARTDATCAMKRLVRNNLMRTNFTTTTKELTACIAKIVAYAVKSKKKQMLRESGTSTNFLPRRRRTSAPAGSHSTQKSANSCQYSGESVVGRGPM